MAEMVKSKDTSTIKRHHIEGTARNFMYLINNGGCFVVESIPDKEIIKVRGFLPNDEFLKELARDYAPPMETGLMPRNTRYYRFINQEKSIKHIVVLEYQPAVVDLLFEKEIPPPTPADKVKMKTVTYSLAMPYIQGTFLIVESGGLMGINRSILSCTSAPLKNLNDKIYAVPLNNINASSGEICWGNNPIDQSKNDTPFTLAQQAMSMFFQAKFNKDYAPNWPENLADYDEWQKQSAENPEAILKTKFQPHGATSIAKIIESYGGKK